MNLYIYNYNNYYNRQVKKAGNSLADYEPYLYYGPVQGVAGFTPGDGVNTTQIIGSNIQNYDGKGDYLIAHNPFTNEIDSRWFIIDTNRTRAGQYQLTLHRDLLADFYDEVIAAPMFVEKATLSADSPLIFNDEAMTVNQIKKNETLLKDKTGIKWLVGYYAKGSDQLQGVVDMPLNEDVPYIQINSQIDGYEYYKYTAEDFYGEPREGYYIINARQGSGSGTTVVSYKTNIRSITGYTQASTKTDYSTDYITEKSIQDTCAALQTAYGRIAIPTFNNLLPNFISYATYGEQTEFLGLDGKIIRDADGRFFNVKVRQAATNVERTINATGSLLLEMQKYANNTGVFKGQTKEDTFQAQLICNTYRIEFTENQTLNTTYSIPNDNLETTDAPWNIFAIPYGSGLKIKDSLGSVLIETDEEVGLQIAASMQKNHPSIIYDIQVLPYFPYQELITDDGEITVQSNKQYSFVTTGINSQKVGIIFNINKSKFSFDLNQYPVLCGVTNIEKKVNNQCDKWRIASPNYSNYFDFSVEKNGGIQYFNVDCEYKPFTPYVHINPNFNGLYGYDDNSPRGLVLGGDFSISQIIDQWQQYQIQNKNFQNIFDRQIQNMEINQKYQRIQEKWAVAAGAFSGAAGGGMAGGMIGGPVGMAVGAGVGAVTSLAGGIADIAINEKLRSEAIDYTKDQFGYQLGNIQALPETISKVSAINNNNKGFPILEYYTCTDEEKEAFVNKIAYNGMTTMIISKISNFLNNDWEYNNITDKCYIKGQLIRLDTIEEDFHFVNAIAGELNKGVFIK